MTIQWLVLRWRLSLLYWRGSCHDRHIDALHDHDLSPPRRRQADDINDNTLDQILLEPNREAHVEHRVVIEVPPVVVDQRLIARVHPELENLIDDVEIESVPRFSYQIARHRVEERRGWAVQETLDADLDLRHRYGTRGRRRARAAEAAQRDLQRGRIRAA